MNIPIFQVDAFTDRLFAGNPAAICPLSAWLDETTIQAVAAENNLSETAFLVGNDGRYGLRWFTPLAEVDLCGHATLASAYVVFHVLEPDLTECIFDTRSGTLRVRREGAWLHMDFPALPALPCECPGELAQALGVTPGEVWRAEKYLAVFADEEDVRALAPNMDALKRLDAQGVIVTAPGRDADFVSRFFAPRLGVPEDPVTGSAHCTLVPYWARRLGKRTFLARQVSRRGGEIRCTLNGERVGLAGQAVLYLRGEITLPGGMEAK
ncbi:MAG: PhzF family phenazine biosynthesis protein [Sulfuricella sp.]|nr:PhzF family phenazine biosynthesis protein [Sulfuricella sp.]